MAGKTSPCDHLRGLPCIPTTQTSQKNLTPGTQTHPTEQNFPRHRDFARHICALHPFRHRNPIPQNNKHNCHRQTQGTLHLPSLWKRPQCAGNYRVPGVTLGNQNGTPRQRRWLFQTVSWVCRPKFSCKFNENLFDWVQNSQTTKAQRNRV